MQIWDKNSIKNLRASLKLSQAEFAHRLGCRQQTVSEWELGLYAPANAYGKLLNHLAATKTSWLSTPKVEEPAVRESNRDFDPAID